MGIRDVVSTLMQVPTLLALKKGMKPRPPTDQDCFARAVVDKAERFGSHTAVISEGRKVTWAELNALANRNAAALKASGIKPGDTVSLMMENRIEFLAALIATNKLGVIAGLINSNLRGRPLIHCITATDSRKFLFGEEVLSAVQEVKSDLPLTEGSDYLFVPDAGTTPCPNWADDFSAASANEPNDNHAETQTVTLGDTALYIFTSGTTGLPKAAIMSNRRFLASAMLSSKAGLKCDENDCIYLCLPLYHTTGLMIGFGSAVTSGATMFIRRKFSASNFLREVREHNATCLIYIGELCRYLNNTPRKADDHDNPLRNMMGNGLRPDVWMEFKERFGIQRITEIYGASEGNVAFANLLNKDRTVGMTSSKVVLVKYDVDADEIVKDANGFCVEVADGEPGLLLGHINPEAVFEGYTDEAATEKKIERDVFEEGDSWFNTGDLMRTIDVGYTLGYPHYQFVDRVGDTFRWKSENVSTNEVGEILNGFDQIEFCNVYGVEVPGADGRAGMVALRLEEGANLDLDGFAAYVAAELPSYARPLFVRIQEDIDVTSTFKMVKGDLRRQSYDITTVSDQIYVMKPGSSSYEKLDPEYYETVRNGKAGF